MRKRSIGVILLLLVMLLTMVGCGNTSNSTTENTTEKMDGKSFQLVLEPSGEYNIPGFGEEYGFYRFNGTDIVVYQIGDDSYLIGEDAGKNGTSYALITYKDSHLLAISDKYLLFATSDGTVAVDIKEIVYPEVGKYAHKTFLFDELPVEELEHFLYVESYEKVVNEYR